MLLQCNKIITLYILDWKRCSLSRNAITILTSIVEIRHYFLNNWKLNQYFNLPRYFSLLSILLTKKKKKKTISNIRQLAFDDLKICFHFAIECWHVVKWVPDFKKDRCTKPWTVSRIKDVRNVNYSIHPVSMW